MQSRIAYKEIYDYSRLEKAAKRLHLEETEETEIGLLNLHNHLIWHSYKPGVDPVADAIFLSVTEEVMQEYETGTEGLPELVKQWLLPLRKGESD